MIDGWTEKSNKLTKQTKHRYSRGEENRESYKVRNTTGELTNIFIAGRAIIEHI